MALFNLPSINPGISFNMPGGSFLAPYLQTPGTGFNGIANLLKGLTGPVKYEPLKPDPRYDMPPIQLPPLPKPQPFTPAKPTGKPLPGNQFSWEFPPVTVGGPQITRAIQFPQQTRPTQISMPAQPQRLPGRKP